MLWPFKFLESFRCSISSVSIYYDPESDIHVKICDHLNFSRCFVVQFRHLDILFSWIGHPCEMLWQFKFLESFRCSISSVSIHYDQGSDIRVNSYDHLHFSRAFVVQFRASWYIMRLNRTFEWKFMNIWISREQPLFNNQCLDILCAWIKHPYEKLWPFLFIESFRCSISSFLIYYAP